MAVANCPSCGAPIEFTVGSSIVRVCDYCRSIVARTDRALEDLGKVAALVETGSPLKRDLPGKYKGIGFRITGRTQLKHRAGGVWDEWYAAFDDGRWGWIAEAQGKFYVTFKTAAHDLPPRAIIAVGGAYRGMVIDEIGTATVISGEGEIPWRVEPGSTYDYADLAGSGQRFATIDYSEETPLLFVGEQTSLKDLGIDVKRERPRQGIRVGLEKIACKNCGAPLNLVAPDAVERIVCAHCGAVHDVTDEGSLKFLKTLKKGKAATPRIPLGTKGTVADREYVVAGVMQRSVTFDRKYYWSEYLLFEPATKGFAWLVESDDHWSIVHGVPSADVEDSERNGAARRVTWNGKTFRIFQDANATVEHVAGEFYWRVETGEKVRAIDYVAAPEGLSKEITRADGAEEINYSVAKYLTPAEVETAFGLKDLPRPYTVAPFQPWTGSAIGGVWRKLVGALFVIALLLAITRSRHEVLDEQLELTVEPVATTTDGSAPPPPSDQPSRVFFTKPFTLAGGRNLKIEGYADVNNSWVYIAGDIAGEQNGLLDGFDMPIEHYEGYDDGEHWSEGSRTTTRFLSALPAGTYSMRLEAQWQAGGAPPSVRIRVVEGVFRWGHFFWAFVLVTIPAILLGFRRWAFEGRRWQESMYTSVGTLRSESSDDDDDE